MKILIFAIENYLMDIVTKNKELVDVRMALKQEYENKDLAIVVNLKYKLSILKF